MRPDPGDDYTVPVTVQIPRPLYGRIRRTAEKHQVTVGSLVSLAVVAALQAPTAPRRTAPRKRRGRPWTDAEDRILREQHAAGASDGAISKMIDRLQPTVSERRRSMGLAANYYGKRRLTDAD